MHQLDSASFRRLKTASDAVVVMGLGTRDRSWRAALILAGLAQESERQLFSDREAFKRVYAERTPKIEQVVRSIRVVRRDIEQLCWTV